MWNLWNFYIFVWRTCTLLFAKFSYLVSRSISDTDAVSIPMQHSSYLLSHSIILYHKALFLLFYVKNFNILHTNTKPVKIIQRILDYSFLRLQPYLAADPSLFVFFSSLFFLFIFLRDGQKNPPKRVPARIIRDEHRDKDKFGIHEDGGKF